MAQINFSRFHSNGHYRSLRPIIDSNSQKEKLSLFAQIADCVESPALRSNTNYLSYVSNAVTILLMFCEELDSVTRIRFAQMSTLLATTERDK